MQAFSHVRRLLCASERYPLSSIISSSSRQNGLSISVPSAKLVVLNCNFHSLARSVRVSSPVSERNLNCLLLPRRCSSKATVKADEGAPPPTTITFRQGAKAATQGTLFLGIGALVILCGTLIVRELMPTRMSPNSVFNAVFEKIKDHPEVTSRVGHNVKGYGRDRHQSKEGRRNFIDHDKFTDLDGVKHIRIRFTVEGSLGKANVYAEVAQNMPPGEFVYVIIEQNIRGSPNAVALIDNRRENTLEELQEKVSAKLSNLKATLYGHSSCQWTQRQIIEFGDFAKNLRTVMCDKPENADECAKAKLQGYPSWVIKGEQLPGYQPIKQLQDIVQHM